MNAKRFFVAAGIIVVCAVIPPLLARPGPGGERRDFSIKARQYAFDPPRIYVDQGDEVHVRLASLDVVHGFFLEGYDINAEIEPGKAKFKVWQPSKGRDSSEALVEEIVFTATRRGKFRYRCSHTCGSLHPFMQGELIVRPNYPFLAASGGAVGVVLDTFVALLLAGKESHAAAERQELSDGS